MCLGCSEIIVPEQPRHWPWPVVGADAVRPEKDPRLCSKS